MGLRRWAGVGGVLFVALVVIVNLLQGAAGRPFGGTGEEGYLADLLDFYTDTDWLPTVFGFAVPVIWAGLAVFAVGLAGSLLTREWRSASDLWPVLGIVGVGMQNALFPVVVALDVAQFRFVADHGELDLGLRQVHDLLLEINSISLAIALLGFGMAMLHRGVPGTWLPRVGLAGAALLAVSVVNIGFDPELAALELVGLLGFLLWLVFIGAASAWLLRQPDDRAEAQAERLERGVGR